MKDLVIIKSYAHGITLILNETADFNEILDEIKFKFAESRKFFKDSKMALSIEGRKLDDKEENMVVEAIHMNSDLKILCLVDHNQDRENEYISALDIAGKKIVDSDTAKFISGNITNGAVVETDKNLIILGDVNPGCKVVSDQNIVILGNLYGEAHAGAKDNNGCFVISLDQESGKVEIGNIGYSNNKKNKWGIHKKNQPQIAYVKDSKVVSENLTKESFDFLHK